MPATPPRTVRWDPKDFSPSFLHSPNPEGSTESYISTSSLEYVNAQLVAHGFAPSPGISLDGLSGTDSDRVVKCLLGLISSRVEDMSRTEELSTKLRTLTYDHERLLTMHRIANEKVTNAEKEVNLHKTKLTAAQRTLQSAELAHKQTTAELQRTRTTLQGIRATHQQELKKKEKEYERMADKWNKLSDAQTKLSTVPAGIKCSNIEIVEGSELVPRTPSLLDTALDEAERARAQLIEEVGRLRRLVVKICNQVQAVLFQVRGFMAAKDEEPTEYTMTNLFPMHPPTHAHDILSGILRSLKDTLAALPQHIASSPSPAQIASAISSSNAASTSSSASHNPEEIALLRATITQLKDQLEHAHAQAEHQGAQTQALLDNFIASQQKTSNSIAEMSVELMTAPMADAERERLEKIRQELDNEREKFTQAAVQLGKEKAALEADRIKLLEEKRSWEVQRMLADLPPTPDPHQPEPEPEPEPHPPKAQPRKSPRKPKSVHRSPSKKSPRKAQGHKRQPSTSSSSTAARKATRVFRRPSTTPTTLPAYETEVIVTPTTSEPQGPPTKEVLQQVPHPSLPSSSSSSTIPAPTPAPTFSFKPLTSTSSILPSSFVLPPPSPHASLPRKPLLPPSSDEEREFLSIPQPDFLMGHLPPPSVESTPFPQAKTHIGQAPSGGMVMAMGENAGGGMNMNVDLTVTPIKRPFPVAKPLAQRMVHAYSPVKPSPLSRILMMNDSPASLEGDSSSSSTLTINANANARLGTLHEVAQEVENTSMQIDTVPEEGETFPEVDLPGIGIQTPVHQQGMEHRIMSLAAELGVESPPDVVEYVEEQEQEEPPLKKRKSDPNERRVTTRSSNNRRATNTGTGVGGGRKPSTGVGAGTKDRTTKTRGASATATATGEKENGGAASRRVSTRTSSSTNATASSAARTVAASNTRASKPTGTTSRVNATTAAARAKAGTTVGGAAGPRRVPKDSAEAPTAIRRKS